MTVEVEKLGLHVNFSPSERKYFDKLKAELLALFGGKSYEEIRASEETTLLRKISDKLAQLQEFVATRQLPYMAERKKMLAWLKTVKKIYRIYPDQAEEWMNDTYEFTDDGVIKNSGEDLIGEEVTELPENFWVRGNLDVSGCFELKRLPDGLRVDGILFLSRRQAALSTKAEELLAQQQVGELRYSF